MNPEIKGPFYKGIIRKRAVLWNYRKMTILWSFSYNSFVKFHGKNISEPKHDHVISKNCVIIGCFVKGLHCSLVIVPKELTVYGYSRCSKF